jgi:hypothetical protein
MMANGFLHAGRHRQVAPPSKEELQALLHRIAHRVVRYLERQGLLEQDADDCMDAGAR